MIIYSAKKNCAHQKVYGIILYLLGVICIISNLAFAQTNSNTQLPLQLNLSNSEETLVNQNKEKIIQNPHKRAFIGNVLGSLIGGVVGAGITRATGFASGELKDADKILYGLYAGSIIGSGMGSSIALYSKGTKGFHRILIRAFIPHVIFSGAGLILSQVSETPSDIVILAGMYLIGWTLSPVEAARAYRANNVNKYSTKEIIQDKNQSGYRYTHKINSFSITIKLLTFKW